MSEIELKPCSNVGGALSPTFEVTAKLLRSYCEITAKGGGRMSLTFCLIPLVALALSVVLLAALAIYWHAEARDWAQIAMLAIDAVEDMARDRNGKL